MRKAASVTGLLIVWLAVNLGLLSQDNDRTKLAKAVAEAKVSLDQGLSSSTQVGKPISAKFEIEDGGCSCRSTQLRAIHLRRSWSTLVLERLLGPNPPPAV